MKSKKIFCVLLTFFIIFAFSGTTFAEDEPEVFESASESLEDDGNVTYAYGVTQEMCSADFWKNHTLGDADALLMTKKEIMELNQSTLKIKETIMNDLLNMKEDYNADSVRQSLANEKIPSDDCYVNGVLIDKNKYFDTLSKAILNTGFTDENAKIIYAVGAKHTQIRSWPTMDFIGYSEDDTDDEVIDAVLEVNEPFIIKQKCTLLSEEGEINFYWGYSNNCFGWINAEDLAICKDRDEWLDAWQVDPEGDDFLVVTQDKIVLEKSRTAEYSSEVKLAIGTVLKLVPEEELPESIKERGTLNNYVVYLPTRDSEGNYVKKYALISQHCDVHVGFVPLTQANLLDMAFSCLGNRYGWGGMLDAMDCSLYTRTIYKCFGLELPRNTTGQPLVPEHAVLLAGMSDTDKEKLIETFPAGTLLYFQGHAMFYLGSIDGVNYCINATGSFSDPEEAGALKLKTIFSIVVNPLTVRRGSGLSWLSNLSAAVLPSGLLDISECSFDIKGDAALRTFTVEGNYFGTPVLENINYTVSTEEKGDDTLITFAGINNFTNTTTISLIEALECKDHVPVVDEAVPATCTKSGLSEGSHCEKCGKILIAQQVIAEVGHHYTPWHHICDATDTSEGYNVRFCKDCSNMEVEMIPVSKGQGKENTGEDIGGGTGEGTKGDAKTGDSNHAGVWILISIVSALSMAVIMISVYIQHQKIRK